MVTNTTSIPWVARADIEQLTIEVPPIEAQRAIAAVLNAQDKEVRILRRRLDALKRGKKGLLQQLLTGKVRVKVDAETVKI